MTLGRSGLATTNCTDFASHLEQSVCHFDANALSGKCVAVLGEDERMGQTWSVDEVCSWLISLDLELYCESFRQNAIDGMELSNMTGEILASDLGIGE